MEALEFSTDGAESLTFGPAKYVSGRGVLSIAGDWISKRGGQPHIISNGLGEELVRRGKLHLQEDFHVSRFEGYCTEHAVSGLLANFQEQDTITVAIGGGRLLDAAKIASNRRGLPVICVPTSAATCSSAAPFAVLYDEIGRHVGGVQLAPPVLTLVDLDLIASAPERLLAAGMADALAKWFELDLVARTLPASASLGAAQAVASRIRSNVSIHCEEALVERSMGTPGIALRNVIDTAVLLAALAVSLAGVTARVAVAHIVHNAITHVFPNRSALHGELVAIGVLVQERIEEKRIHQSLHLLRRMGVRLRASDLGVDLMDASKRSQIASLVADSDVYRLMFPGLGAAEVATALSHVAGVMEA